MARESILISIVAVLVAAATAVICQREPRRQAALTLAQADPYRDFKSPCGTAHELTKRLGACMNDIFDMLEGRVPEPKSDVELQGYCFRFNSTERCTRMVVKECLTGLHKTAVGAVASATKRWRQRECKTKESRAQYAVPMRCAIKKAPEVASVLRNHTAIMQAIRDLPIAPEEKIVKMCCLLNSFDREFEKRYNQECPKSTALIAGIVHAITDDARNTLCVNPKCSGALNQVANAKYKSNQNLIEPVLQLLFQLSVN